jgi:hypothetical protein
MQVGGLVSASSLHLSNVELDRLFTTSSLTLGGEYTSSLTIDGVLLANNASVIELWSLYAQNSSVVQFTGGVSNFTQPLDVRSTSNIIVSTNVTAISSSFLGDSSFTPTSSFQSSVIGLVVSLMADSDCDRVGNVTISAYCVVTSSNRPLLVQTHDLDMSGILSAGLSFIRVSSCSGGSRTIDIGGDGLTSGDMRVSEVELSLLRAANVSIQTNGNGSSIRVHSVSATDVSGISDSVTLDARTNGSSISFLHSSEWRSLIALASSGLSISGNVSTTIGNLWLEGDSDSVGSDSLAILVDSLWLSAAGAGSQLLLQPSQSGNITAVAPVFLSGSNGVQIMAPTYIQSGSGVVRIQADSDVDGLGVLLFGTSGSVNVNVASGRCVVSCESHAFHNIVMRVFALVLVCKQNQCSISKLFFHFTKKSVIHLV